jgi:hypothetical protein
MRTGWPAPLLLLSSCLTALGDYEVVEDDDDLSSSSTGGPTSPCHAEPTFDACVDCLIDMHPEGSTEHGLLFKDACLCNNECAGACTAECGGQVPFGPGCSNCIDSLHGDESCPTELISRCDASPTCSAYIDLAHGCPP